MQGGHQKVLLKGYSTDCGGWGWNGMQDPFFKAGLWNPAYESDQKLWFLHDTELTRERFKLLTDFAACGRAYLSDHFAMDMDAP